MNPTMLFPVRQMEENEYPELLLEIPDSPKRLFVRGTMPPPNTLFLCVVGSRATSPYGRRMTAKLISGLAGSPVSLVSGLALGTDAEAHRAALDAGVPTVAVLPSSCDEESVYPASNRALARRILENNGALISEYPPGTRPMLHHFPARNRIMAGMSKAVTIIEASEKSGTLITARLALEYNHEVLAVPHEVGKTGGEGANRLIREGAALVRESADILQALGLSVEQKQMALPTDLTQEEKVLLEALTGSLGRDELEEATGLSTQKLNVALSSLLIRGLIAERLGKVERCV